METWRTYDKTIFKRRSNEGAIDKMQQCIKVITFFQKHLIKANSLKELFVYKHVYQNKLIIKNHT